ncbi:hypothetical protein H206_06974 [Candidatus Electrothrix aarhusensis]|uniref:Uncharacterized protein n=1 Tax=Candidatus Electrothrix aarhusensis TaxID=1859131 RepID=A0A3S3QHN2_9BACT|nr:hypothetical protein H206_06974 [Candidatus Electrothrix aarhusensis]
MDSRSLTKKSRRGRKASFITLGKSCGPVRAAKAAYCDGAAGLEVD